MCVFGLLYFLGGEGGGLDLRRRSLSYAHEGHRMTTVDVAKFLSRTRIMSGLLFKISC